MIFLKEDTASQEVLLGPFVDSTDGVTAETGLTIANTDIKVFKAGATTLANKNSGGATHISGGNYYAVLDATDTDTVGTGALVVQVTGALAVRHDFCVLPAVIYDSLIAGTDTLQVDVTQFGGSNATSSGGRPEVNTTHAAGTAWGSGAITAASIATGAIDADAIADNAIDAGAIASGAITSAKFAAGAIDAAAIAADAIDLATFAADAKALMGVVAFGTAQSVTGTTIRLAAAEGFADDELIGATVLIRSATTGAGQARVITDYVSATDTATVDTWTTTPSGTITYVVFATPPGSTTSPIAANVVQISGDSVAADNLEAAADGTGYNLGGGAVVAASVTGAVGSVTGAVGSVTGAVGSVTGNVGGNVVGSVGSVTGAVGSVTGNVGGNVTGSVGSVAAGGITAASVATGAIDADALAADAVAEIADGVWDEALAGHTTAGTAGKALSDAGAAGDPWSTAVPGAYGAGTAGYIIGTNLDTTVSSRLATAGYTAPLDAAGTRTAVGLASANLDTQLDALPTAVENADALLGRNVAGGSSAGRLVKEALYVLRNKTAISGGTLTVYGTDDVTSAFTATVGTTAGDPISSIDPA